jgi:hypothetical protein
MKKLLGILAITALATSGFAQGTVVFANSANTGPVKQWTSTSDATAIAVLKSNGRVELFAGLPTLTAVANPFFTYSASGVAVNYGSLSAFMTANAGWADIATTPITSLTAGQFGGGGVTIPGIAAGGSASYFILGWNGPSTTIDAAMGAGAFVGESAVFTTATGNPLATPPGTPVNLNTTFTGMLLAPQVVIPEPSTFALAGLGVAAMLILRRRK